MARLLFGAAGKRDHDFPGRPRRVATAPGSDVTRAKMLETLHAGDSAAFLQLPHVLLEDSLTTPSEYDLGLLGVGDRRCRLRLLDGDAPPIRLGRLSAR